MKVDFYNHFLILLIISACSGQSHSGGFSSTDEMVTMEEQTSAKTIFEITYVHDQPVITQGDEGTESNKYGFEGGRALKINNEYHVFTTEMAGNPLWTKTRLAHWKSPDLKQWQRVSTLFESSGDFTGEDINAAFWSPMPTYNAKDERWMLTYVAYNSKPNTDEGWYRNSNGKIWLAASRQKGYAGLAGPYDNLNIIMEAGEHSDSWEGLMGVDSFYPFPVAGSWRAFYGSSPESVGMAAAESVNGSWTRTYDINPVRRYIENPIVTRLDDGRFVALFDGCGEHRKIGYMVSDDGVNWSKEIFFDLESHVNEWWALTRTPLGLVRESQDTYTVLFTAYNKDFYEIPNVWKSNDDGLFDGYFASMGYFTIRLIR